MSVNKVILMGRLGKEPEITILQSGMKVAKFSLATSESYKNKEGQKVEQTEWHNIEAWDKLAEIIEKYVGKGDLLYLEGKIKTDKWQDNEGKDRYTTKIRMLELTLMPKQNANQSQNEYENENKPQAQQRTQTTQQSQKPAQMPQNEQIAEEDDLPF